MQKNTNSGPASEMDDLTAMLQLLAMYTKIQAVADLVDPAQEKPIDPNMYKLPVPELWKLIQTRGPQPSSWIIPHSVPDHEVMAEVMAQFMRLQMLSMAAGPDKDQDLAQRKNKRFFNLHISWWTPTPENIRAIAQATLEMDPKGEILEVGCGQALVARLLSNCDRLLVRATNYQPLVPGKKPEPVKPTFMPVENLDVLAAVTKYPEAQTLLIAWPPQEGHPGYEMSRDVLRAFKGKQVIYVGEPEGGCTGHPGFFATLRKHWSLYQRLPIARWPNSSDCLYIYRRSGAK